MLAPFHVKYSNMMGGHVTGSMVRVFFKNLYLILLKCFFLRKKKQEMSRENVFFERLFKMMLTTWEVEMLLSSYMVVVTFTCLGGVVI